MYEAFKLLLGLSTLLLLSAQEFSTSKDPPGKECPKTCQCVLLPAEVGLIVNCSGRGLKSLPSVPIDTVQLHLDHNSISEIPREAFTGRPIKTLSLHNNSIRYLDEGVLNTLPRLTGLDVSKNSLEVIPGNLPSTLSKLNLQDNKISSLDFNLFKNLSDCEELYLDGNRIQSVIYQKQGDQNTANATKPTSLLPKLKKLGLSGNSISDLKAHTFQSLKKLTHLSLGENRLARVSEDTFDGLVNIQYLDLQKNHISSIAKGTFKKLKKLRHLFLNDNHLTEPPVGLPMLEFLDVSFNRIQKLPSIYQDEFYPIDVLYLGGNPYHCDCDILWLKELFDLREYVWKYVPGDTAPLIPVCASPKGMAGKSWDTLQPELFGCRVEANPATQKNSPQRDAGKIANTSSSSSSFSSNESGTAAGAVSEEELMSDDLYIEIPESKDPEGKTNTLKSVKASVLGSNEQPSEIMLRAKESHDSIRLSWNLSKSKEDIHIQYHVFGKMKSKADIFLPSTAQSYTMSSLLPSTGYLICVAPKSYGNRFFMDQCFEIFTKQKPSAARNLVHHLIGLLHCLFSLLLLVLPGVLLSGGILMLVMIYRSQYQIDGTAQYDSDEDDSVSDSPIDVRPSQGVKAKRKMT